MKDTKAPEPYQDTDPNETEEWLDSLDYVLKDQGADRARWLIEQLKNKAQRQGVRFSPVTNTPYCNTITPEEQPPRPDDRELQRRLKSYVRWNAMAMVIRANRNSDGIGGHISTYASCATLYEVGFNHFFKGPDWEGGGDQIYFQGHSSPGVYARAFLEGRLSKQQLRNFRREFGRGGGLASYPHPWLMPDFWQFPSVSMGLAPIMSIYQARFNRYLHNRGIKDTSSSKVWAFVGDGESDEPETLGALTLASHEKLDNLIWVVNCNLQRLDGPVRGNGKIIQELESAFLGAGWNVIKVVWGADWDPLFDQDKDGHLQRLMDETVDGQYQKYTVSDGEYIRNHFFKRHPAVEKMVSGMADNKLRTLKRGGHDPDKVYSAYQAAVEHKGQPTVILAKTIKGYGMGEAGEGRNITHQQKKLNEDELREFRSRFGIPIDDSDVAEAPLYRPPEDSPEIQYMIEKRKQLGGFVPQRRADAEPLKMPKLDAFAEFLTGSDGHPVSTTMVLVRIINQLLSDEEIGSRVVPIIPDEARTFGMDSMFRKYGIYAYEGQLYDPVDSDQLMSYHEARDGQILEEGINEAGSMSSFIAAGTAYSTHGVHMIPFFTYYSMFGLQRIGDLIWAAGDMRTRGFLCGATAGRTTLNGEGLQHQDGHSLLHASTVPNLVSYDPAFAFEIAVIIQDGLRRMYEKDEDVFYYLTFENENYPMPPMPKGVEAGIIKGLYKLAPAESDKGDKVHLFGSGAIINSAIKAQEILTKKYGLSVDVWSAPSYTEVSREAMAVERWNRLHPGRAPRKSYIEKLLEEESGVFVAASDYVRAVPEQVARWVPGGLTVLGTDGFGRSESREALRRHFEVDAESIVIATLNELANRGQFDKKKVAKAIKDLGVDPEQAFSLHA